MSDERNPRGIPDQDDEEEVPEPEGTVPTERSPRGIDQDQDDQYQGDRDVLDEDSPIDFQVEDLGRTIPDPLEEDPAQNYRINQMEIQEEETPAGNYTNDAEVIEDFADRQKMGDSGQQLLEKLTEHHGQSPQTSANDIDAAWDKTDQSGEEAVGGSNPTPDQDVVEEIGEAAGLTYRDDEPLDYSKINERDINRWELNPASMDNDSELGDELDDQEDDEDEVDDDELGSLDALSDEEDLEDLEEIDLLDDEDEDDVLDDEQELDELLDEET